MKSTQPTRSAIALIFQPDHQTPCDRYRLQSACRVEQLFDFKLILRIQIIFYA
ncbi:MAG: hypothetical protein KME60_34630 [Cyanomargarita calcarea GSE-NOS-MK-12-04C]|uniref:Uncharacterized protein n=1 Tax=Cyanomargarita calcarea GSE-NOS-MK-12-04C TaxID=2839659 RepID=A0A951UWC4_9CYAN|nr:hypothetical protein [Cyanomargarita calcarea GSE-NOS-MK-12-04C]